jgi:hypothetical protein
MGFAQLTAETLFTAVTAYAFKNIFHEKRPNGSDDQSVLPPPVRSHLPDHHFFGALMVGSMDFPLSRSASSSRTAVPACF